jgi:hypothetical protein
MSKELLGELPELYQIAFTRDHTSLFAGRRTEFSVIRAGTLALPSGQIVVCDPLIGEQCKPFVQGVLPGHYPVDFSLGYDSVEKDERILFSRILFTKEKPVMWVRAIRDAGEGEKNDESPGILSASRVIALMDRSTADQFEIGSMTDLDDLLNKLVSNYRPHRSWLNHAIDKDRNGIFLTTASSDRQIDSYFAIDFEGDICFLLTSLYL